MSTVSNLIFHNANHYVTSSYGPRKSITTTNGNTGSYHNGTDYGTNGKKIAQYAIEEGSIISCGTASDGAKYVWVQYPRLGVKMLHYHLDSIKVKAGQKVNESTVLGYTGKTGKSTGVHLHLGIKRLSGGGYIDPEAWSKNEYKPRTVTSTKAAVDAAKSFSKSLAGTYKTTANLNVRKGAGITKVVITTIPKGTAVKCYGYYTSVLGTKWLYIQFTYKNVTYTGFASAKYLAKQ